MQRILSQAQRRQIVLLGLIVVVYFAAGRAGLSLAFVNESASPVWPPTGIAIAVLLLFGMRMWPAVAVGALLVNLNTSGVVVASVAIAIGNTLEGVAGAWLARRFARGVLAFEGTPDILRFALVVIAASTIAASIGVLALMEAGLAPVADIDSIWFTWWLGDAVGALVVTPLLILWVRPPSLSWTPRLGVEGVAFIACLLIASLVVFGRSPAGVANYPLAFLVMPVLLWSAFRFSARETVTAAAVMAVIAVHGTLRGLGPFARASSNESLLLLQAFIGVTTTMMLSVAAEVKRRHEIEVEMRSLNEVLERRVTDRTQELFKVNDRLLEAQQVAHVGSWEWEVNANTLWWSEEMYRLYGVGPDDVTDYETFLARVHPEDRELVEQAVRQAMIDRRPFTFDHRIVRPDGSIRILYAAGRVIADPEGRASRMMGIGHDVTERKQAEDARASLIREQAARHEAEESSRAKDTFLAVLSHELRTPLSAALGWAQVLQDRLLGDPHGLRATDAICRNLTIQARLVSDIMDVSRLSAGRLRLEKERVRVPALVEAAIEMVGETAAARRIVIETHASPDGSDLFADPIRLQQVLWNLLTNAVAFGREGGRVRVTADGIPDGIVIAVEDDGPGIDPAFLPYVFEQFRQADGSSTRHRQGLGLGLAIARHIVEQHGGTISATNLPEGGALFTIHLPFQSATLDQPDTVSRVTGST